MKRWIQVLVVAFLLTGCLSDEEFSPEEVERLQQKALQLRIQQFRKVRERQCYEQLLAEAIRQADTLLVNEAREAAPDPGRPDRPEKPRRRRPKDSLPVKPFFQRDSLLPDSLLTVPPDSSRGY